MLLDRLLETARARGRLNSVIEILTLRALAEQAQRIDPGAVDTLEQALRLAAPEGYVRVFLEEGAPMAALLAELLKAPGKGYRDPHQRALLGYMQRLMAAFESPHTGSVPPVPAVALEKAQPLPEHLTTREGEVLCAARGWPLQQRDSSPALHRGRHRQIIRTQHLAQARGG